MKLSIKYKIRLGTAFLFLLLLLSGGFSIYFLLKLKNDSKIILQDNYVSLEYCHHMQRQLDSIQLGIANTTAFNYYLQKEEANITEKGEQEAVENIRLSYGKLIKGDSSAANYSIIKSNIQSILTQNMIAIEKKNLQAEKTSENASTAILLIVGVTLLVGITFGYNFPAIVVTPIKKLLDAIGEISRKNYSHKIHLDSTDEFGQLAQAFNNMTARLEEFESSNLNKLMFEKARAEAVINSLKDASIGIDKNDTVLFANQQALQLLSLKKENVVGQKASTLSNKNDLFKFLITNDSNSPFKIVVDGRENYYVKEVFDVAQEDNASKVIVVKNITSFKELDVAKTNFIATVSHELKTPLASSDFSIKLLEDNRIGKLSDEQKELVTQLKNDNQRMLRILSELLNMSQAEAGKIQLNIQEVNPTSIIHSSVEAVRNTAKEKSILIEQFASEHLPTLQADADKLGWVLNNFLTNAIKFSQTGSSIQIAVAKNAGSLSFSVSDNGPGIDKAFTGKIFERYYQIPGRSDKKGSGIGLAICKEFIEAMGGKIWVKSEAGKGSIFGFDLAYSPVQP